MLKLHPQSGAVSATSKSTQCVILNIFEGELDGVSKGVQALNRVHNTLTEYNIPLSHTPVLYGDNLAVVDFIHGRGSAKGVRHMQLRLWYCREQNVMANVDVEHMAGAELVADYLTKLADIDQHNLFTIELLGLHLLGITDMFSYSPPSFQV